jgi:uroporphyrinogen-III decarboxylase
MTGLERLVAAVTGTPADRIPVFCNLFDQGARELNLPLHEYYSRGEYVAEAQLWMRERLGYDNVWGLMYAGKEAELLGSKKILFSQDGPPNVEDFVVQSNADIDRLEVPTDVTAHPAFEEISTCMKILEREAKGKHVICAYVTGTMTLPALLMGMDKWMEMLLFGDPALRDELLGKCHDFFVKETLAYRALGADLIVYVNPFGSTEFVPTKFFRERVLPWIEKDVSAVGSDGLVYYTGSASTLDVIDDVRSRTGIAVWYLSPLEDLYEGKRIVGATGLTCGVINDIQLMRWSRDEIRNEVKRILDTGMPGGHFLFGTGVMPYHIPDASVRTMLDAAYEFGRLGESGAMR